MSDSAASSESSEASHDRALASDSNRLFLRALLLLLLAGAFVVIGPLTPLSHWFEAPDAVARWFRSFGSAGVALFITAMLVSVSVGVPRLLFCPVAGALFGFWNGLALCIAGASASYYLAFLFVRGRIRDVGQRPPIHRRLAFLQGDPGVSGVILARLVPLPGALPTLALATSGVGHGAFLFGSAVGLIPEAVPFVLAGSGVARMDPAHVARMVAGGVTCVVIAWMLTRYVARGFAATRDRIEP